MQLYKYITWLYSKMNNVHCTSTPRLNDKQAEGRADAQCVIIVFGMNLQDYLMYEEIQSRRVRNPPYKNSKLLCVGRVSYPTFLFFLIIIKNVIFQAGSITKLLRRFTSADGIFCTVIRI
jgi:hypothetical protein